MRNTYRVTYRSLSGRIKTEDLLADSLFDSAATVRQSHKLKSTDIISNEIKDKLKLGGNKAGKMLNRTWGRNAFKNDR